MENPQNQISKSKNTANILQEYLSEELTKINVIPEYASYLLEFVFGAEIHTQIDGFVEFSKKDESIDRMAIKSTLAHDVQGALNNDKLMHPRVSEYAQFSNLKK